MDGIITRLPLVTNPAFPWTPDPGSESCRRPLLMAYEGVSMDECLRLAKGSEGWAMIVASQDLLREHLRELRGVAKRVDTLDRDMVGYGANTTGYAQIVSRQ